MGRLVVENKDYEVGTNEVLDFIDEFGDGIDFYETSGVIPYGAKLRLYIPLYLDALKEDWGEVLTPTNVANYVNAIEEKDWETARCCWHLYGTHFFNDEVNIRAFNPKDGSEHAIGNIVLTKELLDKYRIACEWFC